MSRGLTIGQAAAFAGVSVKTVRHYHRLGLLDEPRRDASGYRRYGSAELLRLVQVRTLAGAGVPLAEVGSLLDADRERFAAALAGVHQRLTDRIDELVARRDTLHRLAEGDRALLPDRACAFVQRLARVGLPADYVASQREALVLARALVPEGFDELLDRLERRHADPAFVELTSRSWDALSWDPADPRLEELAAELAANLLADRDQLLVPSTGRARSDAVARYGVINQHREDRSPTLARLNELVERDLRAAGVDLPPR